MELSPLFVVFPAVANTVVGRGGRWSDRHGFYYQPAWVGSAGPPESPSAARVGMGARLRRRRRASLRALIVSVTYYTFCATQGTRS